MIGDARVLLETAQRIFMMDTEEFDPVMVWAPKNDLFGMVRVYALGEMYPIPGESMFVRQVVQGLHDMLFEHGQCSWVAVVADTYQKRAAFMKDVREEANHLEELKNNGDLEVEEALRVVVADRLGNFQTAYQAYTRIGGEIIWGPPIVEPENYEDGHYSGGRVVHLLTAFMKEVCK